MRRGVRIRCRDCCGCIFGGSSRTRARGYQLSTLNSQPDDPHRRRKRRLDRRGQAALHRSAPEQAERQARRCGTSCANCSPTNWRTAARSRSSTGSTARPAASRSSPSTARRRATCTGRCRRRQVEKEYLALVWGWPERGRLRDRRADPPPGRARPSAHLPEADGASRRRRRPHRLPRRAPLHAGDDERRPLRPRPRLSRDRPHAPDPRPPRARRAPGRRRQNLRPRRRLLPRVHRHRLDARARRAAAAPAARPALHRAAPARRRPRLALAARRRTWPRGSGRICSRLAEVASYKRPRMSRYGKCQNFSGCLLAYRGEETEVEDDQPFVCAECGKPLTEVGSPSAMWLRYGYAVAGRHRARRRSWSSRCPPSAQRSSARRKHAAEEAPAERRRSRAGRPASERHAGGPPPPPPDNPRPSPSRRASSPRPRTSTST